MTVVSFKAIRRGFVYKVNGAKIWRVVSLHAEYAVVECVAAVHAMEAIANWAEQSLLGGEPYLGPEEADCPLHKAWLSLSPCDPVIAPDMIDEIGIGLNPIKLDQNEIVRMMNSGYPADEVVESILSPRFPLLRLGDCALIVPEQLPPEILRRHRLALNDCNDGDSPSYMPAFVK
jgi:hypothetical protein